MLIERAHGFWKERENGRADSRNNGVYKGLSSRYTNMLAVNYEVEALESNYPIQASKAGCFVLGGRSSLNSVRVKP